MDKMICIKNLKVHIISKIFTFLINMSHHLVCPPTLPHLKTTQQTCTNRIKNNHKSCNRAFAALKEIRAAINKSGNK